MRDGLAATAVQSARQEVHQTEVLGRVDRERVDLGAEPLDGLAERRRPLVGAELPQPFPRLSYAEALRRYGPQVQASRDMAARADWDTGDSIMSAYAPWCDRVFEVRNLRQLAACVDEIT